MVLGTPMNLCFFAFQFGIIGSILMVSIESFSADIEQTFNVIFFPMISKNLVVSRFVALDLRQFETAGSQKRGRCSLEHFDVVFVLYILGNIHQIFI